MPRTRENKPKNGTEDTQKEKENDSPGKYVKARKPLLQLSKTGGIQKSKKPVPDATIKANKQVRLALATGEITKDELNRKTDRDLRTLYIRFKSSETSPKTSQDIFALDKGIKDVRVPRQGKANEKHNIKYCFVEFNDESTCESTKDKLAANPDFAVDFVGDKSKNRQEKLAAGSTKSILVGKMPINPCRLHVSGVGKNITTEKLKALFPKSKSATIPKGVEHYGFVEFFQPADAKAAFDAAKKLKLDSGDGTQSMTVVFARMQKHGPVQKAEEKEDKAARKKRQREQHKENAKKAKIEEKETQSAWNEATKSKTDETEEETVKEAKEDDTDTTDKVDKEKVAEEEQSESDEDVENDEVDEDDDKDELEIVEEKVADKVEEKKVENDKNDKLNEDSEGDDDEEDVENDETDEEEEEEKEENKVENDKTEEKDGESEEDGDENDVENDETDDEESD